MKIAMVGARGVGNQYSGIETHLEELCPRLVGKGHEVTVFARSYFTLAKEYKGVRVVRLPTIRTKHLDTLVHSFIATMAAIWSDADVVHFHALGPSLFAPIPKAVGRRVVVTVHGLDWQREKWGRLASWWLRRGEHTSATVPSATIVVSQTLRDHYRARYPSCNIHYIPNGVTITPPSPPQEIGRMGLARRGYTLFVGRLTPEKGCHLLIDAYKDLSTERKLVVAGGSAHTDGYVRSLTERGNGRALFLGTVQKDLLAELYSNAYLFVLPSLVEGLPICLLEAMSHGLCVVASDIAPNLEVVDHCGLTFPAGDSYALASVLRDAMAEPDTVLELGCAARERIRHYYNWESIADQTEAVYLSILTSF
ncbi:MAG: glycosyltransferase family 4 protein [Chloroflexi bacterium]|nr:glycosyltransferase family 4 protein [Chloroflexota bacterium]